MDEEVHIMLSCLLFPDMYLRFNLVLTEQNKITQSPATTTPHTHLFLLCSVLSSEVKCLDCINSYAFEEENKRA